MLDDLRALGEFARAGSIAGAAGENQISLTDPDSRAIAAHTHVAVGYKCRPSRHGQIASHSNLNRFAKGARAPLEPKRDKRYKM